MDSRIEILGHEEVAERFRRAVERGRLASSFLFVGPAGVGKRTFAIAAAQALLCESTSPDSFEACGQCPACQQVAANSHPDLAVLRKPNDRSYIPIELLIGDREHRMQEGLCHNIGLKPFRGGRKIAVIDDADFLNQEGANCLLKTLEEPPPRSVIILISTSEQRQLPTIRSRCQVVRFRGLPNTAVEQLLLRDGGFEQREEAERVARLSGGSLTRARELSAPELESFRETLVSQLRSKQWNSLRLADEIAAFVNEAGKDAGPRRERMRLTIGFILQFYRQRLREVSEPGTAVGAPSQVFENDRRRIAERSARCLERCIEADAQVISNANQTTLIESFVDDLANG